MTRQRRWQLKQQRLKKCICCGAELSYYRKYCDRHAIQNRLRARRYKDCERWTDSLRGRPPIIHTEI